MFKDEKFRIYVMLGLLFGLISFSLIYPNLKLGYAGEERKLEELQEDFKALKASTMADAAKEARLTALQLKISNQTKKVEESNLRRNSNDMNLTEIVVYSSIALMIVWICFWKIEPIAYMITLVVFSISCYTYLKNVNGIDLLDQDTQIKIGILIILTFIGGLAGIYIYAIFNRANHKNNMYRQLENHPVYIDGYASNQVNSDAARGSLVSNGMYALVSDKGIQREREVNQLRDSKEDSRIHNRYDSRERDRREYTTNAANQERRGA